LRFSIAASCILYNDKVSEPSSLRPGNRRGHARERFLDARLLARVRFSLERLGVAAVGVGILLELRVRLGDVEDDVAVRRQAVGEKEMLQRRAIVVRPEALGAEREVEIGLAGDIRGLREKEREKDSDHSSCFPWEVLLEGEERGQGWRKPHLGLPPGAAMLTRRHEADEGR
jgi:hypothetical protein